MAARRTISPPRDFLSQWRAPYRPCLRGCRGRCDRTLQAYRRLRRLLHDGQQTSTASRCSRRRARTASHPRNSWTGSPRNSRRGERLNCSFDRFIRTTDPDHLPSTHELWKRMQDSGDIYLSKYEGWYRYVTGLFRRGRTHAAARRQPPRADRRAGGVGGGGRLTSVHLSAFRIACWRITREHPESSAPIRRRTRSSPFAKPGLRISRSAAPPSTGGLSEKRTSTG